MITEKAEAEITLFGKDDVVYKDQYGQTLKKEIAEAFFRWTNGRNGGFDGNTYGVYVDYSSAVDPENAKEGDTAGNTDYIYATVGNSQTSYIKEDWNKDSRGYLITRNGHNIYLATDSPSNQTKLVLKTNADYSDKGAYSKNIKYSVVKLDQGSTNNTNSTNFEPGVNSGNGNNPISSGDKGVLSTVGNEKNITYTIVPVKNLNNLQIKDIKNIRIETSQSKYANGQAMNNSEPPTDDNKDWNRANTWSETRVTSGSSTVKAASMVTKDREVIITGSYNGNTITIPVSYYDIIEQNKDEQAFIIRETDKKVIISDINTGAATSSAITYGDLYNFNDAKNLRRNTKKLLSVRVYEKIMADVLAKKYPANYSDYLVGTAHTNVTVTDARRSVNRVTFKDNKTALVLNAKNTIYDFGTRGIINDYNGNKYSVQVWDDCEDEITSDYSLAYTVLNYEENPSTVTNHTANDHKYTHLPKSFVVKKNGTISTEITGAEIGDKFNLTISITKTDGTDLNTSVQVPVTIGADQLAKMSYGEGVEIDETETVNDKVTNLRDTLGYDR